jgi:glutathione S-transferase
LNDEAQAFSGIASTIAAGDLFTTTTWSDGMKFDLSAIPNLAADKARVAA